MRRTLARLAARLLAAVPLLWVVTFLSFFLVSLVPGDAAVAILGPNATPAQVQALRRQLGLNQPLLVQYGRWLHGALHGDFGSSLLSGVPVSSYLNSSLAPTLSLVIVAVLVSACAGTALGVASAIRGRGVGRVIDVLSFAGLVIPSYWLALLLISVFADRWRLFPAVGYVSLTQSPAGWVRSLVLPVAAASLVGIAVVAKQTRDSMLDTFNRGFIKVMQANGMSRRSIIFKHALRNAAIPVVTFLGVIAVALLSAVVFVETIFALPGLGSAAVNAATQHDLPVLQGVVVYFTLIVIAVNILVDLSYSVLDPRVRER